MTQNLLKVSRKTDERETSFGTVNWLVLCFLFEWDCILYSNLCGWAGGIQAWAVFVKFFLSSVLEMREHV